ncbi:hypothetical protein L6452_00609 [Arctium lappa]|uniref:Uncharacterized protein n=1 Tax=Arctium lappa TaxID=4217 RepID=A0ACB9FFB7_ARCLA|nr:hypothetical protein L6452_00609 [Arctium lappa]
MRGGGGSSVVAKREAFAVPKSRRVGTVREQQSFPHASFEAPGFRTFDSWRITNNASNDGSDCCLWDGVVCSNEEEDGHVIGVDLSERFLPILQLPKLKFLDLASNSNLTGFLPEFLNSSLLEYLDLYSTGFSGFIPKSVVNLNRLTFLSLSSCSFLGIIPGSLANMTQLTHLELYHNKFTGAVPSLASLTKLTVLELSGNNFEEGGLPDWLGKLTNLPTLHLARMNLYGEISPYLANLTKLSCVGMEQNSLVGRIPSSFMNLTQLSKIDLGLNQLQGPISSSFSNFKSLQALRLNGNNFSGKVELDWFIGLNKLEALIIGRNKISFVATNNYTNDTLPELDTLDLSSCNLKEYPAFLRFQYKMRFLFLTHNNIHGLIPEWSWINSQETLEMIDLSYNFITGFHQHHYLLPLVRLKCFFIAFNMLHGRLPIPPRTIEVYGVSKNHLEGEIPPLICELKSLRVLCLSSNNITGILPPCFGSLSNSLSGLDLSNNYLQGTMMNSFTQDNPLKFISLSGNQFVGQVSKSLINCTHLEILLLGDNSFADVFPFWLGNLVELQVLILRSNKFYGEIEGLTTVSSQFPKLRIIDLSKNGFSGQFPHKYFQSWNAMKLVRVGQPSSMETRINFIYFVDVVSYVITITYKSSEQEFNQILNLLVAIDLSYGRIPQGPHFDTFDNNSYLGNLGLCGKPLSKECQHSKVSTPPQTSNISESFLPSERVDWIVIFSGLGSGLVIGIVFGNFLYARYNDWFIEQFGMQKDKWVRPLSNRRRNQAL